MAVICNVPGQTARERAAELRNIQSKKPYPNCNICDVPGQTAQERIQEIHNLRNRKNQVPSDTFSLSAKNSNVKNESFVEKFKKLFK